MNFNTSLKCSTCGEITDCRIGMSNRDEQPFRFSCQTCSAPIDILIKEKGPWRIKGAIQQRVEGVFTGEHSFVDLHLDFPVSFDKYVMGHTPFLKAVGRIGHEAYVFHDRRLNALNALYCRIDDLGRVIRLYFKNHDLFARLCESRFDERIASQHPEDIDAALYAVIAKVFFPFSLPGDNANAVTRYLEVVKTLSDSNKAALDAFVAEISSSGFLKNIQKDCLEIYPRILAAELPLRPALFLDFDKGYGNELVAFRVSHGDFTEYRELFKDIAEVISRQLVLVAGINNLVHRGDHNAFANGGKNTPASLHTYADVPLGSKLTYIDSSWYPIDVDVVDHQLRNSVAHYKAEYDEVTQVITYYPRREGMKQEEGERIYFLDFMRKVLLAYREMHRMHQLIKCLNYYHLLIYPKRKTHDG